MYNKHAKPCVYVRNVQTEHIISTNLSIHVIIRFVLAHTVPDTSFAMTDQSTERPGTTASVASHATTAHTEHSTTTATTAAAVAGNTGEGNSTQGDVFARKCILHTGHYCSSL